MKTKDVPAIVMLLAGAVYSLYGIINRIPLTEFLLHLLVILLVFWMFGGIVKIMLDRFVGEIETKEEDEDSEEPTEEDSDGELGDADSVKETSRENE
jgi:hypothetical protein